MTTVYGSRWQGLGNGTWLDDEHENVTAWEPLVSTTGLANPIGVLIVVRFEPKLFVPPPVWLKAPVLVRGAAFPTLVVKVPELVTVVVPPTLHAPFVVKLAPVKLKLPV